MTLYRGPGGTGSATSDADTTLYQDFLNQTIAARDAAVVAKNAAETAETNAETAETNAETAETNAETAAANAASSASAAASSASSASTSASNASTSASAASTSATAAASSASSASSSASAASTSASNAATSATNAASSASSASTSATNAANSASTATTQATNAASSATAAASSASSASTSATNAANSASSASTSATNAATSATSAAASASAAAASAASIDASTLVRLTGDQTIGGTKTFTSTISGSITGNAGTVTNGVYTTGDQTIGGTKTFSVNPVINAGTANGVAYLNGSKVLTTGSALTFDGSQLDIPAGTAAAPSLSTPADVNTGLYFPAADQLAASVGGAEGLRLTSTGLGIGTSSPSSNLDIRGSSSRIRLDGSAASFQILSRNTADSTTNPLIFDADTYTFNRAGSTQMLLSSSGNLGLGVTPSAWGSGRGFEIGAAGNGLWSGSGYLNFMQNTAFTSGAYRYVATGTAARFEAEGNVFKWLTAPSGTAGNAISFTQAMTLDASGNLGIGATSPGSRLDVRTVSSAPLIRVTTNADASGSAQGGLQWFETNSGAVSASITGIRGGGAFNQTSLIFSTADGGANTERARIDSSGNLLVGTTSAGGKVSINSIGGSQGTSLFINGWGSGIGSAAVFTAANTSNSDVMYFNTSAANVGKISITSTATSYVTSSDYRLKENIQPMTGALAKVAALKPCTYKWKVDGSDGEGFIAHELAEVVPQCVTGEKDAVDAEGKPVYQGIDTSFLAGLYAAALQELMAEVNSLKAEIAALKA